MRQEEIKIALAFLSFCTSVVVYYYMQENCYHFWTAKHLSFLRLYFSILEADREVNISRLTERMMRNRLRNSMVGEEGRRIKYLIEQKAVAALQHSLHPSHPHQISRVFLRLPFYQYHGETHTLYISNYRFPKLQFVCLAAGWVCGVFRLPPLFFALQIGKLSASCENCFWNSPDAGIYSKIFLITSMHRAH